MHITNDQSVTERKEKTTIAKKRKAKNKTNGRISRIEITHSIFNDLWRSDQSSNRGGVEILTCGNTELHRHRLGRLRSSRFESHVDENFVAGFSPDAANTIFGIRSKVFSSVKQK